MAQSSRRAAGHNAPDAESGIGRGKRFAVGGLCRCSALACVDNPTTLNRDRREIRTCSSAQVSTILLISLSKTPGRTSSSALEYLSYISIGARTTCAIQLSQCCTGPRLSVPRTLSCLSPHPLRTTPMAEPVWSILTGSPDRPPTYSRYAFSYPRLVRRLMSC